MSLSSCYETDDCEYDELCIELELSKGDFELKLEIKGG